MAWYEPFLPFVAPVLDFLSAEEDRKSTQTVNEKNLQMQRYFFDQSMDKSISRRVKDGASVGLSAMASLGHVGQSIPSLPGAQPVRSRTSTAARAISDLMIQQAEADIYKTRAETLAIETQAAVAARQANQGGTRNPRLDETPAPRPQSSGRMEFGEYGQEGYSTGRTPAAEEWENRYGELGGIIGGLINAGFDLADIIPQWLVDDLVEKGLKYRHGDVRVIPLRE